MNMTKSIILIIIMIFLILGLSNSIFALGLSPSYAKVDFEPGLNKSFKFLVYGDEKFEIYINSKIEEYVQVSEVKQDDNKNFFWVNLSLPKELPGGKHRITVGVKEVSDSPALVSSTVAIQSPIFIFVEEDSNDILNKKIKSEDNKINQVLGNSDLSSIIITVLVVLVVLNLVLFFLNRKLKKL